MIWSYSCVFVSGVQMFCLAFVAVILESVFFFKQKTAYEMRISDWSSDVCSSDLHAAGAVDADGGLQREAPVPGALLLGLGADRGDGLARSGEQDRKSVV